MDNIKLTSELKEIKEKLLDYVNEIVVRQNQLNPLSNYDSFIHETEARKILKELLAEFKKDVEAIQKK